MTTSTSRKPAGGPAAAFFEALGRGGSEPALRTRSGRIRFDLVDGRHTDSWFLSVDDGAMTVVHGEGDADCVIRGDRAVFDEVASGRANAIAAVLRGALSCRGDLELLFAIQRIFPDPPRGWDPTADTSAT